MSNDTTYTRFYWRFVDEYAVIYDDKLTFGWWMTLLVIADGAHPSSAYLPRAVPARVLNKLVDAGLLELNGSARFHIKGVAAERTRRSEAARVGGLVRGRSLSAEQTVSKRLANGQQTVSLAEPSLEEISRADVRLRAGEFKTWAEAMAAVRKEGTK